VTCLDSANSLRGEERWREGREREEGREEEEVDFHTLLFT